MLHVVHSASSGFAMTSTRALVRAACRLQLQTGELELPLLAGGVAGGELFSLAYYDALALTTELREWMLASVQRELRALYAQSRIGWDERAKREEFSHERQRFLVVSNQRGSACAFLAFRWDVDDGRAVMYVYELFVDNTYRARGIGVALMTYAETLCNSAHIRCIVLTVFSDNVAALNLYRNKLDYLTDRTCPSEFGIQNTGYQILSKQLL
eukprot:TRINITY_DN162_c0_g1_i1.p2 TRINITY_DN162_c0_g1~~TRINITY_DN162_c0_g1_i1.p2  ORF type:complete len:212 (-),score=36.62 TRINITY_DN162_c0_g1_i1:2933-3568(-)